MNSELRAVLKGADHLCTHIGSSQYSGVGSSSACGLAAMNCVRYVFSAEQNGVLGSELLGKLLLKQTMEDIMSICLGWTSNSHLEIDDIYKTPLFGASLNLIRTDYGRAGEQTFKSMLSYANAFLSLFNGLHFLEVGRCLSELSSIHGNGKSYALVITRPPEIVTCLKVVHPLREFFVIFDSHPRPTHPGGAAFFFSASIEAAVLYLSNLFSVDARILAPDSGLQWQAELLAHVSGHFFAPSKVDMRMSQAAEQAFLEANCAILSAQAREKEALSQHVAFASENERLKKSLELMEDQMERLKTERASLLFPAHKELHQPSSTAQTGRTAWRYQNSGSTSRVDTPIEPTYVDTSVPGRLSRSRAAIVQEEDGNSPELSESFYHRAEKGKEKVPFAVAGDDFDVAVRMQLEFQLEDAELTFQLQQLQTTVTQEIFDCSICMDQAPIDDVARMDDCDHLFCRTCIRQYISTKLDERKFPMTCPCCSAEKDGGMKGTVSVALIHQIGVSEQAYTIFNELQITKFSVPIHCRRCNRSGFVDKREFEQSKILFCPFPNCSYSWCKDCQREVPATTDGPIHSCDGSEEFNHLMSRQGWKHCPGCRTPTEKIQGCNHMTCGSPGCNTHFCYVCGGLIVQSSQRGEINNAVGAHYRGNCHLFHVPEET